MNQPKMFIQLFHISMEPFIEEYIRLQTTIYIVS